MYQFAFYPDSIPEELKPGKVWVCCDGEKEPKIATLQGTPRNAASTKPETWRSFETACKAFDTGRYAGVGRVIVAGGPYVGIDIDGCRDATTGHIDDRGREILGLLDSYSEVSPSETGVKVWVRASLKRSEVKTGLEIYRGGRYFTTTGQFLPQYSTTIEDRDEEIRALIAKEFPKPKRRERAYNGPVGKRLDLEEFLEKAGVEVLANVSDGSAEVKLRILCPWIGEHTTSPESGTCVGQYPDGALFFWCWHAHCGQRDWSAFRWKVRPASRERRVKSRSRARRVWRVA